MEQGLGAIYLIFSTIGTILGSKNLGQYWDLIFGQIWDNVRYVIGTTLVPILGTMLEFKNSGQYWDSNVSELVPMYFEAGSMLAQVQLHYCPNIVPIS